MRIFRTINKGSRITKIKSSLPNLRFKLHRESRNNLELYDLWKEVLKMMPVDHLIGLVDSKRDCQVFMRSLPELVITGKIEGFDLDCVPSMLVVNTVKGRRLLNMQDIAVIAEKLQ